MPENVDALSPDEVIYTRAKALVFAQREASVALVQRHLRLGYGATCSLFERMQAERLVAPVPGKTKEWVLIQSPSHE